MVLEKLVLKVISPDKYDFEINGKIKKNSFNQHEARILSGIYHSILNDFNIGYPESPDFARNGAIEVYNHLDSSVNMSYHLLSDFSRYMKFIDTTRSFLESTKTHKSNELKYIVDIIYDCVISFPLEKGGLNYSSIIKSIDLIEIFYSRYESLKKKESINAIKKLSELHDYCEYENRTFINSNTSFISISDVIRNMGK